MVLSPHGNVRYFLDGHRPLWHFTGVFSHGGNVWYILRHFTFFWVTLACVWCCDASKFTEHENHQTSNSNMKYSGEHNKRHVQITGRHSQPTGNDDVFSLKRRGTLPDVNCFVTRSKPLKNLLPPYKLRFRTVQYCHMDTSPQQLLQNDSSTHPIMYSTRLRIHVPIVPLVETQLIKCLQAEQITFSPLMKGLKSCITCQIHDLLALLPAAVLTTFTVTGVPFSE